MVGWGWGARWLLSEHAVGCQAVSGAPAAPGCNGASRKFECDPLPGTRHSTSYKQSTVPAAGQNTLLFGPFGA